MYNIEINPKRNKISFHNSKVVEALPDFYDTEYPLFIKFLETYYDYMDGDADGSFSRVIRDLFHGRDISALTSTVDDQGNPVYNDFLDLLFDEIGDGLNSSSFHDNPRMMARLISDFYRSKGTQISAEQFFKAFFNEDVEVTYPKRNIFILNDQPGGSLIGPESLKYIQDDKRYQIFSVLLKTGLSFSDYEDLYKRMVHPAGFYLAADVVINGLAIMGVRAGLPTDPLAPAEYPMQLVSQSSGANVVPEFNLLNMSHPSGAGGISQFNLLTASDPVDSQLLISSMKILDQYHDMSLSRLQEIHGTIAEWGSPNSVTMDDQNILMSDTAYCKDADEAEDTLP